MDYTKFAILTMACIGGFMVTSYYSLAMQKGWPIGTLFENEKMSYLNIGGFMCQFGSVLISFFVNPWWSAFVVFGLGFIGYIVLSSILKAFSQIVSVIMIVASFILIPLYVFSNSNNGANLDHFIKSLDLYYEATKIINQGEPYQTIDEKTIEEIIDFQKQALNEAEKVDIDMLNRRHDGFGKHYEDKFVKGLEALVDGHKNNDPSKFLQGQILLDQWGTWYLDNLDRIKKEK